MDTYFRPPREWKCTRGILWKLVKLPYSIADASLQWQKAMEKWMTAEGGLQLVLGISQLFIRQGDDGSLRMTVAKVADDFLLGVSVEDMQNFIDLLKKRFIVGKSGP